MRPKDDSKLLDLVVKPDVYARLREVLQHEVLIVAEGEAQRSGGAVNVVMINAQILVRSAFMRIGQRLILERTNQ